MRTTLKAAVVLASIAALSVAAGHVHAQTPEKFYAGRTLNLIEPFAPGGYYDIGARLISRHFGRHIPGKPNVVVQNLPSAGGIGLANRFATSADNDGLTIGVMQRAVPQYALINYEGAKFDPLKLSWVGSISAYETDSYVLILNKSHPAKSLADLKNPNLKTSLGAGRSGSANLIFALVAKDLFKLNVNLVRGYDGTAPIFLALQRKEVDGLMADFSTVKVALNELWTQKDVVPVVQFGRKTRRLPELPDVPTARDLVTDPTELSFLSFAEMPFFMALPLAGPTGIPQDRLKALQDAFMQMAADPAFLDDAKKMKFEVDPISGNAVLDVIRDGAKTAPEVMARFKALVVQ